MKTAYLQDFELFQPRQGFGVDKRKVVASQLSRKKVTREKKKKTNSELKFRIHGNLTVIKTLY